MSSDVTIQPLDVHRDSRGIVSEIYSGQREAVLKNIHIGTMAPDVVRGDHYHERTREWIAFPETPVTLRWGNPDNPIERTKTSPFRIELPPDVPHAFKNVSNEAITFGAFTDQQYDDENPDVQPTELFD
jgi:dTDP-4-dehydrorhamnose 3,5-epimerase-like enzyme